MVELRTTPHGGKTIHDYFTIFLKRRWAILSVFFSLVATVTLYSYIATPIYLATAQVLIERQTPQILDQTGGGTPSDSQGEQFYQTQYQLLESRALAKKVADKLQLKNHSFYAPIFQNLSPTADNALKQQAEDRLARSIAKGVKVTLIPGRNSRLVDVSYSHPDPRFAAQLVNALIQCYIEQYLELRFAASQEVAGWLKQKIDEARKKLEESEAKLNQYKREHNIVTLEDKESITGQKLEQLNRDLLTAQTRRMAAETKFREVSQGHPISDVLNDPMIQTLKKQEAEIIVQVSEMSKKFGEHHPRIIQLNSEMTATRAKIASEMSQVVQSIKNEYKMTQMQEENLKSALESQKADTQDFSDRAINYRMLLRDVETNRAMYENMLKSLTSTTATGNLPSTNIQIIYPATVPTAPVSPKKFNNIMVAVVIGLILGGALAVGLENLDTTLKTPEEVEGWLEIPNLVMIPHLDLFSDNPTKEGAELVLHHDGQSIASELYRILRTKIHYSTPGRPPRVLLVTSTLPMEGKSMTAANLAIAIAKEEGSVLLVDADLRRPRLHQLFQVPSEPGLSNFLVGEIDDIPAVETKMTNLFLVPSGPLPPNPSELLGPRRMEEFLTRAQKLYGHIILDSPPLLSVTDSAILATQAEGVLLVIKADAVPRKQAIEARDQLLSIKAHLLGALLNDVPTKHAGYYYQHYYHYHSQYTSDSDITKTSTLSIFNSIIRMLRGSNKIRL